jgi:hypothetical protein
MARGKDEPFYRMAEVQALIAAGRVDVGSRVRAQAMLELRHDLSGIHGVIGGLERDSWEKSMEVEYDSGFVADVYKPMLADVGMRAYVKFYIDGDNRLRVLSFKRK